MLKIGKLLSVFVAGFLAGAVLIGAVVTASAEDRQVRLFVNNKEIVFPDSLPQIINSRVMVPARPLAEALGAKVDWDVDKWAVIVTSTAQTASPTVQTVAQTGQLQEIRVTLAVDGQSSPVDALMLSGETEPRLPVAAVTGKSGSPSLATLTLPTGTDRDTLAFYLDEVPFTKAEAQIDGRTAIPLELLRSRLGWAVTWDASSLTVTVSK